ncbi:hypothetical protein ACJRO7_029405 [Eucalyptus globulus]|uniref:Uncharacterized protein n=1 Tax=Eucalyptus globulus TaxID=34317 RepID=A0ABD3K0D7_EUCGL
MQNAAPDAQLFQLLSGLLHQVEALTNDEEVGLRSKIEALGLEVTKVPSSSTRHLDELEIAKELDKLSMKLDDVDEMISSTVASDPHVQSLLSGTANRWMPISIFGKYHDHPIIMVSIDYSKC